MNKRFVISIFYILTIKTVTCQCPKSECPRKEYLNNFECADNCELFCFYKTQIIGPKYKPFCHGPLTNYCTCSPYRGVNRTCYDDLCLTLCKKLFPGRIVEQTCTVSNLCDCWNVYNRGDDTIKHILDIKNPDISINF